MKESEWKLRETERVKLKPADLLDVDLMKKVEKMFEIIKKMKTAEKTPEVLRKLDNRDNATSLNRMGTETGKILEWGVDPDD